MQLITAYIKTYITIGIICLNLTNKKNWNVER